jgi:hypothetical protein
MNGPVPYGYHCDRAKSIVKPQPEEAKVVRWLFREVAKGEQGSRRLANRLSERGTVNRKGKRFRPSTIETMLRNEFHLGHYRWRQNRTIGADSPVEQAIGDHHPALIDHETFEKHLSREAADEQDGKTQSKIDGIKRQLADLLRDHLDDRVDAQQFDRRNAELKQLLSKVEREAEEARDAQQQAVMVDGVVDQLVGSGPDDYQAAIEQLSRCQQRQVVRGLIHAIAIERGDSPRVLWRFG